MPQLKEMMMAQMEKIKSMIDMTVPYDANVFKEFNKEWNDSMQKTDKKKVQNSPTETDTIQGHHRDVSFKM